MNHIKGINEFMDTDLDTVGQIYDNPELAEDEEEENNLPNLPYKSMNKYSVNQLRYELDNAISLPDFEAITSAMKSVAKKRPYIKTKEPWASVWQEFMDKWHEKYQEAGCPDNNLPPEYKNGGDEPYESRRY